MSAIGNPIKWDNEGNAVEWECLDKSCRVLAAADGDFFVQTRAETFIRATSTPYVGDGTFGFRPSPPVALDNPKNIHIEMSAPSETPGVGSGSVSLCNPNPSTPLSVVGVNPKDRIGVKKPNLHLVPSTAIVHCAKAMEDGAAKYGPYNWRDNNVLASVYVSAAERHIRQWFDGEDRAEDSGQHHLAHAMACLAILLDAEEGRNLTDDRPNEGETSALIKRLTTSD